MPTVESELVEIEVEIRARKGNGLRVFDGRKEVWLPKSLTTLRENGKRAFVKIPDWLAKDRGLI